MKATVMKFDCIEGPGSSMSILAVSKATPTEMIRKYETLMGKNVYSYPNPSKGETNIRFPLSAPEKVSIGILDLSGKLVWSLTLDSRETSAGINKVVWYGVNDFGQQMANGVYLLMIQAGDKTVKKKIAVVR